MFARSGSMITVGRPNTFRECVLNGLERGQVDQVPPRSTSWVGFGGVDLSSHDPSENVVLMSQSADERDQQQQRLQRHPASTAQLVAAVMLVMIRTSCVAFFVLGDRRRFLPGLSRVSLRSVS